MKKGMYFTLMTIGFLAIFIFVFSLPNYQNLGSRMITTEMRIDAMDDFVKDLKRDTKRGLYISGFRAMMSLEEEIIRTGDFLADTESVFKEALLNGTINNTNVTLMERSTLPNWVDNIQNKANQLNINATITLLNVSVFQQDPFRVTIAVNLSFSVTDITNVASWNTTEMIETDLSIVGFEDPLYIVYSLGRTTNIINQTLYENNFTFQINDTWNVSNLEDHAEQSFYVTNTDAPSFLQRFENDLTPSVYGIESLVNLKKLEDLGLTLNEDASIVDHLYWQAGSSGDYRINFTPNWMVLDLAHLDRYNATDVSYLE